MLMQDALYEVKYNTNHSSAVHRIADCVQFVLVPMNPDPAAEFASAIAIAIAQRMLIEEQKADIHIFSIVKLGTACRVKY
jgi:hypothetical protein